MRTISSASSGYAFALGMSFSLSSCVGAWRETARVDCSLRSACGLMGVDRRVWVGSVFGGWWVVDEWRHTRRRSSGGSTAPRGARKRSDMKTEERSKVSQGKGLTVRASLRRDCGTPTVEIVMLLAPIPMSSFRQRCAARTPWVNRVGVWVRCVD